MLGVPCILLGVKNWYGKNIVSVCATTNTVFNDNSNYADVE